MVRTRGLVVLTMATLVAFACGSSSGPAGSKGTIKIGSDLPVCTVGGQAVQNGIQFELAVADVLVLGEDHPTLGGDLREPDMVLLVGGEVVVMDVDNQIGELAERFGEEILSEAAIDEEIERVIPLGPIARTGSLLQFRELFAHSPSPGR